MKKAHILLAFMAIALAFTACKKTLEGETKKWESRQSNIADLKTKYPAFSAPLDEALTLAQSTMAEAESVTDQEARIQKMAEANGLISGGWISQLGSLDKEKQDLRDKVSDLNLNDMDEGDLIVAESAVKNADRTISNVELALRNGARDIGTAKSLLKDLDGQLDQAGKELDKIAKNMAKKDEVKEQKEQDQKEEVADWKCGYCDKLNAHDARECSGCGAPREN